MGFLEGLFSRTVPELPVATEVVIGSGSVEPGYLHRVAASDSPIVLNIVPHAIEDVVGKRFAIKVFVEATTPPGGTLTILAPDGQQIEAETGERGDGVELEDQTLGTYREWLCD